ATDPYTAGPAQHATLVEPAAAANGSMIVAAFQVGRFNSGGNSTNTGFATSADRGQTWTSGTLPSLTTASVPSGPFARAVDPSVAYDAAHGTWIITSSGIPASGNHTLVGSRSPDGLTWSSPVTISLSGSPDKDWIACDNTASSPYYGHCYAVWADLSLN